jgi:hypothetical protein
MGKSRNIARLVVDATGAVDATNLGNAVPADGSITEAKLASDSVTAAKIATGAVGADELAATAVTAGTYGTASAIPAITVDADGRITGVTTNSVSATPADGSITDAKISDGLTASTTYYPIWDSTISPSWFTGALQRLVSFRCTRGGVFNIRFRIQNNEGGGTYTVGSRVYVNGVAVGSLISAGLGASAWRTDTHSNITIARNQVVDIYVSSNTGGAFVTISGIQFGTTASNAISAFTYPTVSDSGQGRSLPL